jgi:hypothetical protein
MTSPLPIQRRGHSLLELVLSLVLLSIIFASVGSAVMFAARASPSEDSFESTLAVDSRVISQIAEDLSVARHIIEQKDHSVTIVVGDRTNDGNPDRIRYAWSGNIGDPLTYQLNDQTAYNLIDSVHTFELVYSIDAIESPLPVATYFDGEKIIDAFDDSFAGADVSVTQTQWHGQTVIPRLTAVALGFLPTRLELYAGFTSPNDGQARIALRDRSGTTPGENNYAAAVMSESKMTGAISWRQLAFSETAVVPADQDLALTAIYRAGTADVLDLRSVDVSGGLLGLGGGRGGQLFTSDGTTWSHDSDATLVYRVYGREMLTDSDQYFTKRDHYTSIKISLQGPEENRSPLIRNTRLLLSPTILGGFAETAFYNDPTKMDLNADGRADWLHSAGTFPVSSLSKGMWISDGELSFVDDALNTSKVINITARMRSNDTLGPAIHLPYIDGTQVIPVILQLRDNGSGGQELAIFNTLTITDELTVVRDLPAGLVDIGVKLIPDENYLYIEVNHQPMVAMLMERIENPGNIEQAVMFTSSGGIAEFGSIDIRLDGAYAKGSAADAEGGGLISDLLNLLY